MIILRNWLVTITFNPAEDTLFAELPNVEEFGVGELKHALEIVADNVISYDVKNLLLDSTNVSVGKMDDREYGLTVKDFIRKLTRTRLQRFARLNSSILSLDHRALTAVTEIFNQEGSSIQFQVFNSGTAAAEWLRAQVN
ncbi:hypothetical protein [Sabulibacter ruber]|uniref:hypothetical protein n=1 Tax=Sabulibacter ruber TaxID=2811901 RepID=UPI001A9670F6|nr:hypothetical protein [Sabulibacter ruber]